MGKKVANFYSFCKLDKLIDKFTALSVEVDRAKYES